MYSMMEEIGEKIDVIAVFTKNKVIPIIFSWKNKRYTDLKPVSVWLGNDDGAKLIFISLLRGRTIYELCFHTGILQWTLEKIYQEPVSIESNV